MAQIPDAVIELKEVVTKWEYMSIPIYQSDNDKNILNEWGMKGWELIAVLPDTENSYPFAYLKRPLLDSK